MAKKKIVTSKIADSKVASTTDEKFKSSVSQASTNSSDQILYGKDFYIWMLAGVGLIALGIFLMSGGQMPDDNTWDPDLIYSFRRTTLAPIVILAGLGIEIYAIFKK